MKKILLLVAVCGTLAVASSCTKHACPAYGSVQKTQPAPVVKA
ncbi:hypothetical protein [Dyadobacter fermentans]|nr:hypothetical protein [Dyadobacter fermentans]